MSVARRKRQPRSERDAAVLKKFGARVREIRDGVGISQEQLALKARIDRAHVSGIETGRHNPGVVHIYRIAAVLKVPPGKLFPD